MTGTLIRRDGRTSVLTLTRTARGIVFVSVHSGCHWPWASRYWNPSETNPNELFGSDGSITVVSTLSGETATAPTRRTMLITFFFASRSREYSTMPGPGGWLGDTARRVQNRIVSLETVNRRPSKSLMLTSGQLGGGDLVEQFCRSAGAAPFRPFAQLVSAASLRAIPG